MNKNTVKEGKTEIQIDSDFWRTVIEQACINQALTIMMNEIENLKQRLRVQLWVGKRDLSVFLERRSISQDPGYEMRWGK